METYLIRYFLPPRFVALKGTEEYWRAFLCVLALVLGVLFSLPPLLVYIFWLNSSFLSLSSSVLTILGALQLIFMRIVGNVRLSSVLLVVWLFGAVVFGVFASGGIDSAVSAGLYAPILVALVELGTVAMLWALGFAAVCIGLMVWLEYTFTLPTVIDPSLLPPVHGAIAFSVVSCTIFSFYYFVRIRHQAYQMVEQERDSVQMRVQEATHNLEVQNTALQQALRDVELANKLKDEFLRNVSHEVRTPMTAIIGFSEILMGQIESADEKHVFAEQIQIAATNLMNIFSNILTLSRIEAGEIESAPNLIGVEYVLRHVRDAVTPLAQMKGLELSITTTANVPEFLTFDAANTRAILTYLAENGVKFTEKGFVRLQLDVVHDERLYLVCTIEDSGIGIASEYRERLFTPFHQQDGSKTRVYGGLGLGLAIAKRMVDMMGGSMSLISEVGKGTTFTVKIPCEHLSVPTP